MPVFPDVASRMVNPGRSAPLFSPSRIMLAAGLSLTDPPGFIHSALARSCTCWGRSREILSRRRRGVLPIPSTGVWPTWFSAGGRAPRKVKMRPFNGESLRYIATIYELYSLKEIAVILMYDRDQGRATSRRKESRPLQGGK